MDLCAGCVDHPRGLTRLLDGYKALAKVAMDVGKAANCIEAKAFLLKVNPTFKDDVMFQYFFPSVFLVAYCEHKLEEVTKRAPPAPEEEKEGEGDGEGDGEGEDKDDLPDLEAIPEH